MSTKYKFQDGNLYRRRPSLHSLHQDYFPRWCNLHTPFWVSPLESVVSALNVHRNHLGNAGWDLGGLGRNLDSALLRGTGPSLDDKALHVSTILYACTYMMMPTVPLHKVFPAPGNDSSQATHECSSWRGFCSCFGEGVIPSSILRPTFNSETLRKCWFTLTACWLLLLLKYLPKYWVLRRQRKSRDLEFLGDLEDGCAVSPARSWVTYGCSAGLPKP